MAPLPLGTEPHPTDLYNIVAMITPVKLVVVALKPAPKTWFRKRRDEEDRYASIVSGGKPPFVARIAWFPSVLVQDEALVQPRTEPKLLYTWGSTFGLLGVTEDLPATVKKGPIRGVPHEQGRLIFNEIGSWKLDEDIISAHWLSSYVSIDIVYRHFHAHFNLKANFFGY